MRSHIKKINIYLGCRSSLVQELSMLFQELKEQAFKLPKRDRLALVSAIVESLQEDTTISQSDRPNVIGQMRDLLKSDSVSPKSVPINTVGVIPKFGSAKGSIRMSDDFDEPLEDFEEYAP